MTKNLMLLPLILGGLALSANGAELYKVSVSSQTDAQMLSATGADAIVRLDDGYLVLADAAASRTLESAKLESQLLAVDVSWEQLALDNRLDDANLAKYTLVYSEDNLRLYQVDPIELSRGAAVTGLRPLRERGVRIEYRPPRRLRGPAERAGIDLDSLISQVSQDSLLSYTERLQAFYRRPSGSDSNYAAAAWTKAKFSEFGYDSVYSDTFTYSIWGTPTLIENTVAVKLGSRFPERYIIVCGHRDGVPGSPAADDNGSGTAMTLEIARVLKDAESYCSFVFVTFDAEEDGLIGSEHFAAEAAANSDTIIWVLNGDMIAYYENSSQAKLYHGSDQTYSIVWQDLADSLLGLSGVLSGTSGGSDHYPFQQEGYDVTFVHEYVFSSVYHGSHDSTTYMDFVYMMKMVKASLAAAYMVMRDATAPGLGFEFPEEVPGIVMAGEETTFPVTMVPQNGGLLVPNSVMLHYSIDGAPYQQVQLSQLFGLQYLATLPAILCENTLEFYFSAEEQESGTHYSGGPASPYVAQPATDLQVAFADDFESDQGWTISGGLWQRGSPTGSGGDHGGPDPVGGHNSVNCLAYNLNGDYENNLPERHVTSPAFDCSSLSGTSLTFWRWLGVERPLYDHAYVRISTNGTSWTTIWENTAEVADYAWQKMEYDISDLVDGEPTVYLRFTMGETDGAWRYCGWNIDDLEIYAYICETGSDSDGDGVIDSQDNCPLTYNPDQDDADLDEIGDSCDTCTDTDGDGYGNPGFPASTCATDNCPLIANADQSDYDLDGIGDSCDICTDYDDDGYGDPGFPANTCATDNCPLTPNPEQLDPDDDSVGTACDNCPDVYNPDQTDSDGDSIGDACDFICGDADGDEIINISDAVYLISYIFAGGPAPEPLEAGDADCNSVVSVSDAVYLIAFIFAGGPEPCAGCP